ncbi:MAG: hypothetical protein J2P25_06395 [Nocardiopsaceae bacterium]|nr:hypothetical protein [Nocardiopsaceae bacterium]
MANRTIVECISKEKTAKITPYRLVPQVRDALDDMFDAFAADEKIREYPREGKVRSATEF